VPHHGGITTARKDALFDSSAPRIKSIIVTILLLANLHLGRAANLDDSDTTRKVRKAFLDLRTTKDTGCGICYERMDLLAP